MERSANVEANALAKLGAFPQPIEGRWIQVETIASSTLNRPHCNIINHKLDDWREPIIRYILEEKEPEESFEKRRIKSKATHFMVIGEELYRKKPLEGNPLKICFSNQEGRVITKSIHQGGGGVHQGAKNMARQIECQGCY